METFVVIFASIAGLFLHLGTKPDFKDLKISLWDDYVKEHPWWVITTLMFMVLGLMLVLTMKNSLPATVKTPISVGEWTFEVPKFFIVVFASVLNGYANSSFWKHLADKTKKKVGVDE